MTLDELRQSVYDITSRPDLASITLTGIQAATIDAHKSEDYPKDITERPIVFPVIDYTQSLEYRTLFPRFRRFAYIRNYAGNILCTHLRSISPFKTQDEYGLELTNIYYLAGDNIQIRLETATDRLLAGVYQNPDVSAEGYDSWIAREEPFAIIHAAAAFVLRKIGFAEDAQNERAQAQQKLALLMTNIFEGQDHV